MIELSGFAGNTLWFALQYLLFPTVLFYVSCFLWEKKCVAMKDNDCSLPLPKGKMGFPFVGEMLHFLFVGVKYQRQRQRQFGDIYKTHLFGRPTIVVIGEENVRRILLGEGQVVQAVWPSTTRRILGTNGMVNGDKASHHRIKRLALRAFSPKYIGTYTPVIKSGIVSHIKEWQAASVVPIFEACTQMVSKTMMTVLLGIQPDDPDIQKYIQAADDIVNSILSLPVNLPGFRFRKGLQAQKFIFDKVATELRSRFNVSTEDLFQSEEEMPKFQSILVNILNLSKLSNDAEMTLENLQNLTLEFIFAGSQSLRCACSLMILHLSQHPEIADHLRMDIRRHNLWKRDLTEIGLEEIEALESIDKVVKETLRVTPTIPGAIRVALKTFELGGFQIPKGWQINYSIRFTHERAAGKVLQDGTSCVFEPKLDCTSPQCPTAEVESLSDEKTTNARATRNDAEGKFGFIPFGKGARMCAGKSYGLMVLRILLFELVRTVDVRLCGESKLVQIPMTRPDKSVKVKFSILRK